MAQTQIKKVLKIVIIRVQFLLIQIMLIFITRGNNYVLHIQEVYLPVQKEKHFFVII